MTLGRWRLDGFTEAFERWCFMEEPSNELRKQVLAWLVDVLAADPFQPDSAPFGGEFPITWWFAQLPYGRNPGSRVWCGYEINSTERALTCRLLGELNLG